MTFPCAILLSYRICALSLSSFDMASLPNNSDEYVESSASDDERPNRWHGPPSTWQQLNIEEIDTITALNDIRNQDLSVHLYNAFALKQRHNNPLNDNVPIPNQVGILLSSSHYLGGVAEPGIIRISMRLQGNQSRKMTGCHNAPGRHGQ